MCRSGRTKNRYKLLEALSQDTTSPIIPAETDGKKYLQIMVGACSGLADVQTIKKQCEAGMAIVQSLAKIQTLFNMKVKRLHTNGAKKQDTAQLRGFLAKNETSATHTAPNALQSNSFEERRFRQLMATTRTVMKAAPHMPKTCWSYAVLDAADKGTCLATSKQCHIEPSPYAKIERQCPTAAVSSPEKLRPWEKKGTAVSAVKFKKKVERRSEDAYYLRMRK